MDQGQFLENVRNLREEGKSIRAVASELRVHPSRVQRALNVIAQRRQEKRVRPARISRDTVFVGRQQEMSYLESALADSLSEPPDLRERGGGQTCSSPQIDLRAGVVGHFGEIAAVPLLTVPHRKSPADRRRSPHSILISRACR